jgi:phage terminase large subunit
MLVATCATVKTDAVCIREVQRTLNQSVKKLLESKISSLNAGDYFEVQDKRILSTLGGQIIFEGMQNHTADSIKSLEGYRIAWVEEAQSLSQRSLDLLRPTIRMQASELWFGWNPDKSSDPVDALLRGGVPPPNTIVVEANYQDNPWFPDVLRDEMEYDKRRDPDKYAHIWLGHYLRNSEARVFKNWTIDEFDAPADAIFRMGADWGFATDPSVLVRCYIVGRTLYVDFEAYMVGCEIVNLPDLFLRVPGSEKWPITADSARPETVSHMQKHGFPHIRSAIKGAKSLEEGVEWLKSYDMVVHPRCQHLIDELSLYCYKTDEKTQQVLPVLSDKDNHVIDALRYALEGIRRVAAVKPVVARKQPAIAGSWMG